MNDHKDLKLSDFVKIYDGVLPVSFCRKIVEAFESSADHHIMSKVGEDEDPFNDYRQAIEMNCSQTRTDEWKFLLNSLNKVVVQFQHRYISDMKELGVPDIAIPASNIFEQWRMHKYEEGYHFYKPHVDSHDSSSAARMLAFLFYPNNVEEGGETAFTGHLSGLECKPMQGRLLIFPTWFGYPHEAKSVIKGTKYMIKTYVHYPGELDVTG